MDDDKLIQLITKHLSDFERQTGQVPSISELAKAIGVLPNKVRRALKEMMPDEHSDGTSAFQPSRFRDHEVLLLDEEGTQLGILPTREAWLLARERDLMLLVTQPEANPPRAQLMDFGKHKYELRKQIHQIKQKHGAKDVKTITMRDSIAETDFQVKVAAARKFLRRGDKVELVVELTELVEPTELHHKRAQQLFDRLAHALDDVGHPDADPLFKGASLAACFLPKPR